ncbi:MAG: hypothetical protein E7637_01445 [Ruminococcaceae bacterium]|nr:hypothetical protein [Oscillospiraceae bacterium]
MSRAKNDPEELLEARIGDALEKCRRGSVAVLPFLSPRGRNRAERELSRRTESARAWFFGGYREAERVCLFLLPDYLCDLLECPISEYDRERMEGLLGEEISAAVCALRVRGSRYRTLTHRDYLGSILGLGIERDAIGDIAVQNDHEAVIFCSRSMAEFLCTALEKVATDTVRCSLYTLDESFTDGKKYAPVNDTVASARLDCVVAALTGQSREDAQRSVRSGMVEVEFEPEERVDLQLEPPLWISVRGYGRFRLRAFDGETKKGRLRMRADRLI